MLPSTLYLTLYLTLNQTLPPNPSCPTHLIHLSAHIVTHNANHGCKAEEADQKDAVQHKVCCRAAF